MTSSDDELANLLETLRVRFSITEELIKNYKDRDDGYYVQLAGDEKNITELTHEQLRENNRRVILKQMIYAFVAVRELLVGIDPEIRIKTFDYLIDELWSVENGYRNEVLIKPKGVGRGKRPSIPTSIHRVSLAIAYQKLRNAGVDKETAIEQIANQSPLEVSATRETIKDILEVRKDDETQKLFKHLKKVDADAEALIALYKSNSWHKRG
jgi:hypothetical protein